VNAAADNSQHKALHQSTLDSRLFSFVLFAAFVVILLPASLPATMG